ncbi:MAG: hypothetical protein GY850_22130 [bacterium]|nr:hypothetical protein [bacterium]
MIGVSLIKPGFSIDEVVVTINYILNKNFISLLSSIAKIVIIHFFKYITLEKEYSFVNAKTDEWN